LGHVVERSAQQSRLAAPAVDDEKAGQCGGAKGERRSMTAAATGGDVRVKAATIQPGPLNR